MAMFNGMLGEGGGGMLGQPAAQPANLNLGSVSFADDPYQVKVLRPLLEQAGLWNPAWNEWAGYQAGGDDTGTGPATPDFSSLSGMGAGFGDYGGGNRYEAVVGQGGQEVAGRPYFYDENALFQGEDLAQAAALVGGSAFGLNALFGGVGAAGGAASSAAAGAGDGLMLAGQYGGAGSLGEASLLTGGSAGAGGGLTFGTAGTAAGVGEGLSLAGQYGGAGSLGDAAWLTGASPSGAGALGTLGTLPEVPGAVSSLPTNAAAGIEPATAATLPATAPPSGAGGLLNALTSNPRLVAGLAGGLLGGAEGGGGGEAYNGPMPTITRGGWSATATPTYMQPAAQPQLNRQPGQANSGLWRFMGGQQ